jgi:hypothetical protein
MAVTVNISNDFKVRVLQEAWACQRGPLLAAGVGRELSPAAVCEFQNHSSRARDCWHRVFSFL